MASDTDHPRQREGSSPVLFNKERAASRARRYAADNAQLKALVGTVAPAFEAHMIAAQNLDKRLQTAQK